MFKIFESFHRAPLSKVMISKENNFDLSLTCADFDLAKENSFRSLETYRSFVGVKNYRRCSIEMKYFCV